MSEDDTGSKPEMVPMDRLAKQVARTRALQEQLAEMQTTLTERDTELDALRQQAKAWESTHAELDSYKAKEATWSMERAIMSAGITDPEGVDFARIAYERLPEDGRPEGGVSAWLADADSLPRGVAAYLAPKQAEQAEAPPQRQRWDPNAGAKPRPPTPSGALKSPAHMSIEELRATQAERYAELGQQAPVRYPWQAKS